MADLYPQQLPILPPPLQLGYERPPGINLGVRTPQSVPALWNQAMAQRGALSSPMSFGAPPPPDQIENLWNGYWQGGLATPPEAYQPQAVNPLANPSSASLGSRMIDLSGAPSDVVVDPLANPGVIPVPYPEQPLNAESPIERYTGPDQVPATTVALNTPGTSVGSSGYPPGMEQPPVAGVKSDAAIWGLLAAGLGILANNSGNYGQFGPAVGKGGLIGLNTFLQQRQQEQNNAFVRQRQLQQQQLQNAQIANYESEARKRDYEIQQDQQLADTMAAAFGGRAPTTAGAPIPAPGIGAGPAAVQAAPSAAPGAPPAAAPGSIVAGTTPQQPGSPEFPVQAGSGGIFDPQTYARVAQAALTSGTTKGVELGKQWAAAAMQAEGLRLQGYYQVDEGDKVGIFRANQKVGEIPKNMSMWEQFKALNEIVNTQREAIIARFTTGESVPYLAGSGPQTKLGVLPGGTGAPVMGGASPTAPGGVPGAIRPGALPQISDDPRQVFNGLTPKDYNEALRQQAQQSRAELQKENDALPATQQAITASRRWMELNAQTPTGRAIGSNVLGAKATREFFGEKNMQELAKLEAAWQSSGVGLVGLNNVSNYERGLVGKANMSTGNEKEVNDNIGRVVIQGALNAQDKIAFKEWFYGKYQTLNRSDGWWNDYINTNPTYVTGKGTDLVKNPAKMSWQEYAEQRTKGGIPMPMDPEQGNRIQINKVKPDMYYITPHGLMTGNALLDLNRRMNK